MTPPPTTINVLGRSAQLHQLIAQQDRASVDGHVWRLGRPRTGGDDERIGPACRLALGVDDLDRVRVREAGGAAEQCNAVAGELRLRDVDLVLDHLLNPEGQVRHGDLFLHPVVDAVDALVLEARQMQDRLTHRLAGDGAGIDARAADDILALDERDAPALLGGVDGCPLTGWSGADHHEVERLHVRWVQSARNDPVSTTALKQPTPALTCVVM